MIIFKTKNPDEVQKLLDKKIKAVEVINGESVYNLDEDVDINKILETPVSVEAPAKVLETKKDAGDDTPKTKRKYSKKNKR